MEDKKVIRGTFPVRWHKDGQDGKDGTNVWMKYAKTLDKGTYPSTMYDTFSSDMNYIGIGNGRGAEPTDPTKYAWKKIKGEDGTSFTAKGNAIAHYANKAAYEAATKTAGLYLYDDSAGAKLVQWNGSATTEMSVTTGDAYTTSDMHLWVRDETRWVDLGMIQGPAGTPGDDGESYWIVPSSETVPLNSSGYPVSTSISATAWRKIGKTDAVQIKNNEGYTLSVAAHYEDGTGSEVTEMDGNGKVTLSYDSGKVVQSVTMKLKKGTTILDIRNLVPSYNGKNGTDGKNAIRLDLDNENDTMLYDSNGQCVSGDIITNAQLYDGATAVPSDLVTYDVDMDSSEGCTYEHQQNSNQFTVTGMTEAAGWLRIKATYNDKGYFATLTLKKIVGQCKYDIVTDVSAITKDANTGTLSPATVTAYIRKTDASGNVTTTQGTASGTANKIDDKRLQVYNGVNWSDVSGTSINTSGYDLILRISEGTHVYDQETLPLIISGKNGTNGDDAVSYWLDCSHMAVPCTSDGKARSDVSIKITAWQKIGNNEPVQLNESNCVKYTFEYEADDANKTYITVGSTDGRPTTIIPDTSRVLKSLSITLKISEKIIQTITLLPVLDGPMGSDGYNYLPQVLGIYSDSESYTWDDTVRQGCFYEISGTYNIYYVKKRQTTNRGIAPTGKNTDPYWSKSDRVYTIFTDALYATNASVGGFLLSDKMLLSAQASYLMTYRGSASAIAYRGAWQSANTYSSGNIVYSDGYFYRYTSSSSTTSKPSVDSRWTKLSESYYTDKYIIDMCTAYGTSSSVTVSLYGYYDSSSKDRPFVYYSSKFWTLKKYGYATDRPSETSTQWRELFDAEKLMLGITDTSNSTSFPYGSTTIYRRSISKYLLNGKEGTTMMLQPDDTIWTYDMTGKQTLGIPYGKHIEIDPADGKIRFYAADGTQNGEVSGDTVSSISDLLGSSATGFTNQSLPVTTYAGNGSIGRRETIDTQIGTKITISGNGALNVSSTLKLQGSQWSTSEIAGGGAGSGSVGPLPDGTSVSGTTTKLYTNTVSAFLLVQKQSGSTWVNVATASSQNSTSATSLSVTSTSSRTVNLSEGTYRIVLRCEISVYANNSHGVGVEASSVSASVTSFVNLHRFFGNGFAFGSSTNNFFAAINEGTNMHTKMLTGLGKFGYELDATYGMQVRRGTSSTSCLQGLVPPVVFFAYIQFTDKTTDGCKVISYNTLGHTSGEDYKPSVSATAKNEREYYVTLTLPTVLKGKLSTSNCFVSVTGINSANVKPTVRPFKTSDNSIKIEMADDESNNFGNFQIKIEYFG